MLPGKLISGATLRDVKVRDEGTHLAIVDALTENLIERWPYVALEESSGPQTSLILQWPPQATELHITVSRREIPWLKKLHSQVHQAKYRRAIYWIIVSAVVAGLVAFLIPFSARVIPWRWEKKLSDEASLFSAELICESDANAVLDQLIKRIYPVYADDKKISIEVHVVRGKEVNAFTFLGGKIYVYEGLLKEATSEEELAGILAHEIEHAKRRHVLQGAIRQSFLTLSAYFIFGDSRFDPSVFTRLMHLQFSRDQEQEADKGALKRLNDSQVSVEGFKQFFERKKGAAGTAGALESLFGDHPSDAARAQLAEKYAGNPSRPILSPAAWKKLKDICQNARAY